MAGIGQYKLLDKFSYVKIPKDEIVIPKKLPNPDEILDFVKGNVKNESFMKSSRPTSNENTETNQVSESIQETNAVQSRESKQVDISDDPQTENQQQSTDTIQR